MDANPRDQRDSRQGMRLGIFCGLVSYFSFPSPPACIFSCSFLRPFFSSLCVCVCVLLFCYFWKVPSFVVFSLVLDMRFHCFPFISCSLRFASGDCKTPPLCFPFISLDFICPPSGGLSRFQTLFSWLVPTSSIFVSACLVYFFPSFCAPIFAFEAFLRQARSLVPMSLSSPF